MIKLTYVPSVSPNGPKLYIIPGGPGLSSLTLRGLDVLKRSFELIYVDIQGTNDSSYTGKKTFTEITTALEKVVKNESGLKYALGHSFGGFVAAELLVRDVVSGLVCISTPFSKAALSSANDNYLKNMSPALSDAELKWTEMRDDSSFANWVSEYGHMYFLTPKGKDALINDMVSAKYFLDNRADVLGKEDLLDVLRTIEQKKIFIAGSADKLLDVDILKNDSLVGGFEFFEVENASHFVTMDQPDKVSNLIETEFLYHKGEK